MALYMHMIFSGEYMKIVKHNIKIWGLRRHVFWRNRCTNLVSGHVSSTAPWYNTYLLYYLLYQRNGFDARSFTKVGHFVGHKKITGKS